MKICLLTDHHVCFNPRLWKEAMLYEELGHEVVILSMWQSKKNLHNDRLILKDKKITYKPYLNLIPDKSSIINRFFYRSRKSFSGYLQKYLKIGLPYSISYAPELMYKYAITENADLYIAHLECAFVSARKLILSGKKVAFDFEDWYSKDYLVPERPTTLLKRAEHYALLNGVFCTAPSISMASSLINTFKVNRTIEVIYNSFPKEDNFSNQSSISLDCIERLKLVWTSRTVGPNRGLENLFSALRFLKTSIELHIIGDANYDYKKLIYKSFDDSIHKVFIYDFVPHSDLLPTLSKFDVGLALEEAYPESRDLTITNKILQYLQAGIPVLATDTKGQNEVALGMPNSVFLLEQNSPLSWANAIQSLTEKKELNQLNVDHEKFNSQFSWELQKRKLNTLLKTLM